MKTNNNTNTHSVNESTPARIIFHPMHNNTTSSTMKIKTGFKAVLLTLLLGWAAAPIVRAQTTESFTYTTNRLVPDGNASGLHDVRVSSSAIGTISSLKVRLKIAGEFNGDMYAYLRHVQNGVTNISVLLNRSGAMSTNPAGYAGSGFNVTFQDAAANGDIHLYQNVTNAASPLTGIWQPDGRMADPGVVTELSPRTASLTNFNGMNAAGEWTLYLADLASGGTNQLVEWGLDINGSAYPTVTWSNPGDVVYGTALGSTQLNETVTYGGNPVSGTIAYSPSSGITLAAGATQVLTAVFTPTDSASFQRMTNTVTLNVQQAPLEITANNTNKVYGAANPVFTASYSGFVNGDTAASLGTPVSLVTTANSASPIGTYPITASGAVGTNYSIRYVAGALAVTTAPLEITANSTNKLYGAANPVFTASYSGFVNGDTAANLDMPVSLVTTANSASPFGSYPITASGAVGTNYSIGYVAGILAVNTATLNVAANATNKIFGASDPSLTYTVSGLQNGDTTNVLTGSITRATGENAGSYAISQGSLQANTNYTIAFTGSSLTIGASSVTGAVASSANPAAAGSSVTFTLTLGAVSPGAGTPTGSVNFRIDGSVAGSGTLTAGIATYSTASLSHTTHTVVAEYAGDGNFLGTTNALAPDQNINSAPVAGSDSLVRYATQGVKVRLATLQTNDSDVDSDALSVVVSSTSASNATVTVVNGWVSYTPLAGFTNADSFTYTINDGHGGSATNTVAVGVQVDNDPSQNLTIVSLDNNSVLIQGSGIPSRTYRMQSTGSLSPVDWQDVTDGAVTADSNGRFQYTDTAVSSQRYYRTVYP